jgi:hypothetical protein
VEPRNPADVVLTAGDILLLEAGDGFIKANDTSPAFGLLSTVVKSSPLKTKLMWPAVGLTAAMIISQVSVPVLGYLLQGMQCSCGKEDMAEFSKSLIITS